MRMRNCSDFRDNICAYIDNELAAAEKEAFEKHLETCSECRKETEEMRAIIGLCESLPLRELPPDFSSELHAKLVAVAKRQDDKVISIRKPGKFKFTRTVVSVAASVLIIFIAGIFYRFGINAPKEMTGGTAYMNEQNAQQNMIAKAAGQKADAGAGMASAEVQEEAPVLYSGSMAESVLAPGETTDSNRSVAPEASREMAIAEIKQRDVPETASKNYSTIILLADDPASEETEIRKIALSNSAMIIEEASQEESVDTHLMHTLSSPEDRRGQGAQLNIRIQYSQYDKFVEELKGKYGVADLQVGAFVSEDMTEVLNTNISISNDLGNRIVELRKKGGEANAEEIRKLMNEKEKVDNQIEDLRLGSDEVIVNIYINKK